MSANAFANPQLIAEKALLRLENNLVFAGLINREYESQFNTTGTKPGATINIRKPARYLGRDGQRAQIENITDPLVPLTIDTQSGLDLGYSSQQEALNLEDYDDQVLEPATSRIAHKIDVHLLTLAYQAVSNHVGTPGANPSSLDTYIDAGVVLDDNAVPLSKRSVVLPPAMEGALIKGEKNRFNNQAALSKMLREKSMGREAGFDFYRAQGVKRHQIGAWAESDAQIAGANQSGSFITTDGWTGTTGLKRGDIFTIAGVYAVNPETREELSSLKQFVVTADCNPSGGNMTIHFEPEIILAGAYQNVSNVPGDTSDVVVFGAASTRAAQAIAFHKDFMTMAMVDLAMPKGVDGAGRANSKKRNLSIRWVRYWDGKEDQWVTRLDVLYGAKVLRPEMACRVSGA